MRRNRSVLIDATIGSILRNVSSINQSNSVNVIAGNRITTRSINSARTTLVKPALNIGGKGMFFISGAFVTQIILSVARASRGSDIKVIVKRGATYDTATIVGTELSIPQNSVSTTNNLAISVPVGEFLFFDVTAAGSIYAGAGLSITVAHYTG